MKNVNKRLFIIVLSGFILMTGCNINSKNNSVNSSTKIEQSKEELKIEKEETKNKVEVEPKEENTEPTEIKLEENDTKISLITDRDKEVLNYFNDTLKSIETEKVKEKAINYFIIVTDFLFFDSEINGIKFDDLKEETKEEILKIYFNIDSKIENKFPNYKETINEKYDVAKEYLSEKYNVISSNVVDKIKEKIGEDKYNESVDKIKETTDSVVDTTKDVYNDAKVKVKDWYQNLKQK